MRGSRLLLGLAFFLLMTLPALWMAAPAATRVSISMGALTLDNGIHFSATTVGMPRRQHAQSEHASQEKHK